MVSHRFSTDMHSHIRSPRLRRGMQCAVRIAKTGVAYVSLPVQLPKNKKARPHNRDEATLRGTTQLFVCRHSPKTNSLCHDNGRARSGLVGAQRHRSAEPLGRELRMPFAQSAFSRWRFSLASPVCGGGVGKAGGYFPSSLRLAAIIAGSMPFDKRRNTGLLHGQKQAPFPYPPGQSITNRGRAGLAHGQYRLYTELTSKIVHSFVRMAVKTGEPCRPDGCRITPQ